MGTFLFNLTYWVLSVTYGLMAVLAGLLPGRRPVGWIIQRYTRRMVGAMRLFAGIKLEVRGKDRLPEGAFIIGAKHQSWGDGFCVYSQFKDLAFVTGDHLEKYPLMGRILKKLGAIVVNNCGGHEARKSLAMRAAEAKADGRRILIYPEGNLSKPGEYFRYRAGIWHMYRDFDMPVVPLATNLGLFWPGEAYEKHPGTAVIEFLDPIAPGLGKEAFLAKLTEVVETRSQELIAEATGEAFRPSVLVLAPDEIRRAEQKARETEAAQ